MIKNGSASGIYMMALPLKKCLSNTGKVLPSVLLLQSFEIPLEFVVYWAFKDYCASSRRIVYLFKI